MFVTCISFSMNRLLFTLLILLISRGFVFPKGNYLIKSKPITEHTKIFKSAISFPFNKEIKVLNANIGSDSLTRNSFLISISYGGPTLENFDIWKSNEIKSIGPLHAKFEYLIEEKVSVGFNINTLCLMKYYNNRSLEDIIKVSTIVRLNHHFYNTSKLDLYYGFGFGYRFKASSKTNTNILIFGFDDFPYGFELTFGIRYYFTKSFGLFTEMGVAKSIVQTGITFKI